MQLQKNFKLQQLYCEILAKQEIEKGLKSSLIQQRIEYKNES